MAGSFVDYLTRRLPLVERALAGSSGSALTDGPVAGDLERYLYRPLERFTASGGKRVRPVLCLLGAEAAGGDPEAALSCAVAVELFQSAALIHDDIADEGELRRGEPCLHRVEGTGLAMNAGDLALTRVFEAILSDERLDAERLAIGRAYGLTLTSARDWVSMAYDHIMGDTLRERMFNNPAYYDITAPTTLRCRQLLEDIPTGFVPMLELGRLAGVETPLMESLLPICSTLLDEDFRTTGRTLEKMGLGGMSFETLLNKVK